MRGESWCEPALIRLWENLMDEYNHVLNELKTDIERIIKETTDALYAIHEKARYVISCFPLLNRADTSSVQISFLIQTVSVILAVAFYTLLERKMLGYIQNRKGPNKPGPAGLVVSIADAVKLIAKEINSPVQRNKTLFIFVAILVLATPLLLWAVYPTPIAPISFGYSALWFLCVSALGVFSLLGAGWSRNRKYSMLGGIRAVAQSVSYEVRLTFIVLH